MRGWPFPAQAALSAMAKSRGAPIALVHYVGCVYTFSVLGKSEYRPSEVAKLAGSAPQAQRITEIRKELQETVERQSVLGRRYLGIALNKEFFERFVKEKFPSQQAGPAGGTH